MKIRPFRPNKCCLRAFTWLTSSHIMIFNLPFEWLLAYQVVCSTEHQVVNLFIWFWVRLFLASMPHRTHRSMVYCSAEWHSHCSHSLLSHFLFPKNVTFSTGPRMLWLLCVFREMVKILTWLIARTGHEHSNALHSHPGHNSFPIQWIRSILFPSPPLASAPFHRLHSMNIRRLPIYIVVQLGCLACRAWTWSSDVGRCLFMIKYLGSGQYGRMNRRQRLFTKSIRTTRVNSGNFEAE